jgi:hypothetical protein
LEKIDENTKLNWRIHMSININSIVRNSKRVSDMRQSNNPIILDSDAVYEMELTITEVQERLGLSCRRTMVDIPSPTHAGFVQRDYLLFNPVQPLVEPVLISFRVITHAHLQELLAECVIDEQVRLVRIETRNRVLAHTGLVVVNIAKKALSLEP